MLTKGQNKKWPKWKVVKMESGLKLKVVKIINGQKEKWWQVVKMICGQN